MKRTGTTIMKALVLVFVVAGSLHAESPKMKMTTNIPQEIITPDKVETRIGALEFFDGFPTEATAQKCFDNLDFLHGTWTFPEVKPVESK